MKKIFTILKQATAGIFLLVSTVLSAQYYGDIDSTFYTGSGFNELVMAIVPQPDQKILVGGWFTEYNGTSQNYITRLKPDGSIDTSFDTGTGFNSVVTAIALQTDGKILVIGSFFEYNGTSQNKIIRLNPDGSPDTSFNIGTGFDAGLRTIALQSDGKILVGGFFTSYNGTTQNRIIRLNPNGSMDSSFNTGTGINSNFVEQIVVQTDGKILVGGDFSSYNGDARNDLVRLNPSGDIDTSFTIGTGFGGAISKVYEITLDSYGRILVGGMFSSFNGAAQNQILRLYSTGNLDTTFSSGMGADYYVETIALQADGKILMGGQFDSYDGTARNNIVSLNPDGSLDTVFNVGTGCDDTVNDIVLQADGKVLVGGSFTSYNGATRNRLVRLHNYEQCPAGDVELLSQADVDAFGANYPNCTHIDGNLFIGSIQVPDSDITDLSPLSNLIVVNGGIYIWHNPELTTLSGLDNLLYAHTITISNNPQLSDITALQNMDFANLSGLTITDNPQLDYCHLANICAYLQGGNPREIHGNSGNCIDEPAVLDACMMSVSDVDGFALNYYPNPIKDILNIDTTEQIKKIEVFDLSGKKVLEVSDNNQINMSTLAPGNYFVKIILKARVETVKVIKK